LLFVGRIFLFQRVEDGGISAGVRIDGISVCAMVYLRHIWCRKLARNALISQTGVLGEPEIKRF